MRHLCARIGGLGLAVFAVLGCIAPSVGVAATLPDGRVYELVSPAEKNGSIAGVGSNGGLFYGLAAAEAAGEEPAIFYRGLGPIGETPSGFDAYLVARRSSKGWSTKAALPRPPGRISALDEPIALLPSLDLSSIAFTARGAYTTGTDTASAPNLYVTDPTGGIRWITEPQIPHPTPETGTVLFPYFKIAGASSDLSTVYIGYYGTLLPVDAPRGAVIEEHGGANSFLSDRGFYEWKDGTLINAGELPAGSPNGPYDRFGATPAGSVDNQSVSPAEFNNQVSADGTRAFFVSPDPILCRAAPRTPNPECEGDIPQLYVRETAPDGQQSSVLISKSAVTGLPSPSGPEEILSPESSFIFASPDGSRVFFACEDALTGDAPSGGLVKEYQFDTLTNTLSYMPGVSAPVIGSNKDGTKAVFEKRSRPASLGLWSENHASLITSLPEPELSPTNFGKLVVGPIRITEDGASVVFQTDSPLPSGTPDEFNNEHGFEQIYHYDTTTGQMSCASCPPPGTTPTGNATLSNNDHTGRAEPRDSRGTSTDNQRVFFDSVDPLVAQDVNGLRDVYEWQNGIVHLISAGTGNSNSYFLDNTTSGNDIFFTTADSLIPIDTDSANDIYDARINGQNFEAAPPNQCTTSCQNPPTPPPAFNPPSSLTYTGPTNPTPHPAGTTTTPRKTTKKPTTHHKKKPKHKKKSHTKKTSHH